jgi:replicative DNA helicase
LSGTEGRTPPHSDEAEQSLIGGLLLDNRAWERCGDLVIAEDFYHPDHRAIYSTIARLINAAKVADVITVFEAGAHDLKYLNSMAQSVVSASNTRAYAEIVRERSLRRELMRIGGGLADDAMRGTSEKMPVQGLVDRVVSALLALNHVQAHGEPSDLVSLLPEFVDHVNAKFEGENDAIETGLTDLDWLFDGGLRPGELMVLGARPSMGKSAFVLTLCRNIGAQHPLLMMTLEDTLRTLVSRMVAAAGGVNLADLRNPKRAPDSMWRGLSDGVEALRSLMIDLDDQGGLTLMDMRRKIQQCKRRRGRLGLVVVDYLQLAQGEGDNRNQSLGAIANGLKGAAKEFNVPVILLSQLNREADKRPGPPQMSDLRDSGDIEGAADIIGLLYREFMRKPTGDNKHHAELHVVKQKNGATGTLNFYFDGALQRFANWDRAIPLPSKAFSSHGAGLG